MPRDGIEPPTRGFFNPLLYQLSYLGLLGAPRLRRKRRSRGGLRYVDVVECQEFFRCGAIEQPEGGREPRGAQVGHDGERSELHGERGRDAQARADPGEDSTPSPASARRQRGRPGTHRPRRPRAEQHAARRALWRRLRARCSPTTSDPRDIVEQADRRHRYQRGRGDGRSPRGRGRAADRELRAELRPGSRTSAAAATCAASATP